MRAPHVSPVADPPEVPGPANPLARTVPDLSVRSARVAGVVGAAFSTTGMLIAGLAPPPDASIAAVSAHLVDRRTELLLGAALSTIGAGFLVIFLGGLCRSLFRRDAVGFAVATLASWLMLLVTYGFGQLLPIAIAWRGSPEPRMLRFAIDVSNVSGYVATSVVAALSIALPTVHLRRARAIPMWLVGVATLEIAANVVELTGFAARSGWNTAGYAAGIAPLLWMVWVLGVAVSPRTLTS